MNDLRERLVRGILDALRDGDPLVTIGVAPEGTITIEWKEADGA